MRVSGHSLRGASRRRSPVAASSSGTGVGARHVGGHHRAAELSRIQRHYRSATRLRGLPAPECVDTGSRAHRQGTRHRLAAYRCVRRRLREFCRFERPENRRRDGSGDRCAQLSPWPVRIPRSQRPHDGGCFLSVVRQLRSPRSARGARLGSRERLGIRRRSDRHHRRRDVCGRAERQPAPRVAGQCGSVRSGDHPERNGVVSLEDA